MLGIFLAIAAGCLWGANSALVRLGLRRIGPSLGTFLPLFSSFVVAGSLALILNFDGFTSLQPRTVLWFGLIGLLNYGIGRQFNYFSIKSIGVARATSLFSSAPLFAVIIAPVVIVSPLQSTSPLFALLWSRLLLGHLEKMTMRLVFGTTLVVVGVALIALGRFDF